MNTVYVDSDVNDAGRRQRLYAGQLFVISPRPATIALCEFAKSMIREAFGSVDPLAAQYQMPVEQYVAIVSPIEAKVYSPPGNKKAPAQLVADCGCDLNETYVDVPRLRMVTSHGYLTSGVGYAHHPPPRYVVLRADGAIELVAADLRHRVRELDGVSPRILVQRREERLVRVQLLQLEQ